MIILVPKYRLRYAIKALNRIPTRTAQSRPKAVFWNQAENSTPARADISIVPSMAILLTPARLEITFPMAAKRRGVVTLRIA
jgi:hypothetical protein